MSTARTIGGVVILVCLLCCLIPARSARPGSVSGLTRFVEEKTMVVKQILANGMSRSRVIGIKIACETFVVRSDDMVQLEPNAMNVERSVLKTAGYSSTVFSNLSETRGFYSADFLSPSTGAPEPAVFSRATQKQRIVAKGTEASREFYSADGEDIQR
tara:strand:+ start:2275 stop:2748 length:474 start_codon:yes stop_codon:yes gene_type:complete